jgi:protein-S-isoprenylcysteine O-methyltransferase Ste14
VQIVGAALCVLGVALVLRSALILAGRGRPERGPRPALILAGPYRRLRNPVFAGLLATLAGTALAMRSGWMAASAALAWAGLHLWVVRVEEPRLRARFGRAYAEYVRRVPRWLPVRRPRGDAEITSS